MKKRIHKSRRYWHKYLVMREMIDKDLDRGFDTDWLLYVNWIAKRKHLPKYHGTKYRGLKRWSAKRWLAKINSIAKATKGEKSGEI